MFDNAAMNRTRRLRAIKDRVARQGIVIGGMVVIVAVMLIFFYLLWEVLPLFRGASMDVVHQQPLPKVHAATRFLSVEEQRDVGFRLDESGRATFIGVRDGRLISEQQLPHAARLQVVARADAASDLLGIGYDDGQILLANQVYRTT